MKEIVNDEEKERGIRKTYLGGKLMRKTKKELRRKPNGDENGNEKRRDKKTRWKKEKLTVRKIKEKRVKLYQKKGGQRGKGSKDVKLGRQES